MFKLTMAVEKDTFLVGEHVQIGTTITNIGTSKFSGKKLGRTEIQIRDDQGNEIKYIGPSSFSYMPTVNELAPGDDDFEIIDLNEFYGKKYHGMIIDYYFDPGEYTVRITYYPLDLPIEEVEDHFCVKPPTGEELLVRQSYVDVLLNEIHGKISPLEVSKALDLIQQEHPKSVYCPNILVQLEAILGVNVKDRERMLECRNKLIEDYPWSVQGRGMLELKLNRMATDSERVEYINRIKIKSNHSMAQKKYERLEKSYPR